MVSNDKASREKVDEVLRDLKDLIIITEIQAMEQGAPMGEALEQYLREHNLVLALGKY